MKKLLLSLCMIGVATTASAADFVDTESADNIIDLLNGDGSITTIIELSDYAKEAVAFRQLHIFVEERIFYRRSA